ncbi:peptidoglycan-binding protein [Roseibium hamelinense]|nr:peptidoglycan-binding protein [Roseibium hamelinense]
MISTRLVASVLVFFVSLAPGAAQQADPARPAEPAAPALSDGQGAATPQSPIAMAIAAAMPASIDPGLTEVYAARVFEPVWLNEQGLTPNAHMVLGAFADANAHALNPQNYNPIWLAERSLNAESAGDWATLDIDLSIQFLRYATHLSSGRVQPNEVNKALNVFPDKPVATELFATAEKAIDFSAFLDSLAPQTPNYARLQIRLQQYREKAANGGFIPVPEGEVLKPGMSDPRLDALRLRLEQEDYFAAADHSGDVYDGALVDAVETFQSYHGLAVDGVVGPGTLAALNTSVEAKLIQMELNMERRRWMPDDFGSTYVFVNLADQRLKVVKDDKTWHTASVIVGKPYHATPVFSDEMTYVEVNPYWNVPRSISTNEYLPQLQGNPNALSSKGIRVFQNEAEVAPTQVAWNSYSKGNFPFRLRQDPGDGNALGRIKFMFPNKFNIYIHDTPSKALFARAQRDFSHGCIRVEDPFALGDILLAADGYDKARLEAIRDSRKRHVISLKEAIPVHLTYLTAWMNKDGSTHFRNDIYGRDKVLLDALAKAMTKNL